MLSNFRRGPNRAEPRADCTFSAGQRTLRAEREGGEGNRGEEARHAGGLATALAAWHGPGRPRGKMARRDAPGPAQAAAAQSDSDRDSL